MATSVPALRARPGTSPAPGTACLLLSGELDLATGPLLVTALDDVLATRPQRLVVDVRDLAFVDLVGLDALLGAQRRLAAQGGTLVLRRPTDLVRRVVGLLGLEDRLPIEG